MPKKILLSFLTSLVILISPAIAKKVDQQTAVQVARNFYYERVNQHTPTAYESIMTKEVIPVMQGLDEVYYVINFTGQGWVLVSADDIAQPVMGYSFNGSYSLEHQPKQLTYWMGEYKSQIVKARLEKAATNPDIAQEWNRLAVSTPAQLSILATKDVTPLTIATWDQGQYYNELCPYGSAGPGMGGHVPTGCVATSMAQVMYYWRFPSQGNGSHSYNHATFGLQSANFGSTYYHFTGMQNSTNTNNFEMAQIAYHCGVSVNMDYGLDGSGSNTNSVPNALVAYFRYSNTAKYKQASSYPSTTDWENVLKTELDNKRPTLYSGYPAPPSTGAGHCWVLDGYQGTNYFHFNWGWSGNDNGYFYLNNLAPPSAGDNFNAGQSAVIGIYPGGTYPAGCSGQQVVAESRGTIEDGSGPASDYAANSNCSWLIKPTDSITSITLTFDKISTDTNDKIRIYGGATTAAPLLATYAGVYADTALPASVTVNGNQMLVTFTSDATIQSTGWNAHYTTNLAQICHQYSLSDPTGTITDGSGPVKGYEPNSICTWMIAPSNNPAILTLVFTEFDTEPNYDFVRIWDPVNSVILGKVSGHSLPGSYTSPTGQMYIEFITDGIRQYSGWTANYYTYGVGIDTKDFINNLNIYPNPASDLLNIRLESPKTQSLQITLNSLDGKNIYSEAISDLNGLYEKQIDISSFAKGVYFLRIKGDSGVAVRKVVVQ